MSDLISRQAAIEAAEKESIQDGAYGYMDTKSIVDMLNDLPAIDPVKHGHWVEDCRYYDLKCSKCGERSLCYFDEGELDYYLCRSKYCPHCGALMDEVINEQE